MGKTQWIPFNQKDGLYALAPRFIPNTKKGTSSITDFYHSLQNLADALYDVDSPITEIELVIQILRQLPTSYHNIVDVIIVFQPTPQHASLTLTAYEAILGPTTFT